MNIGIVTTWFERGAAYVSRQFRDVLAEKHNVFIFARSGESYAVGDPAWDGSSVFWGKRRDTPFVGTYIDKKEFCAWVKSNRIDLVIFNEQQWFQPLRWCKELHVKSVAYIDYYNEMTIPLFAAYDALICNTKRHYEAFSWHPGATYVPWGTNVELFKPKNSECTLAHEDCVTFFHSAGVMGLRKGTDLLISAFSKCRRAQKLIIHTQTPLEKILPANFLPTVEELEKSGRLEVITKTVPAPGLFHLGDVYVYPSRLEGIGLTIAESLACGLCAVVPDNPPMNEFITERTGKLIPIARTYSRLDGYYWPQCEVDESKLAEILDFLSDNPETVLELKRNARRYATERLNQKVNFEKITELVENVEFSCDESIFPKIDKWDNRGLKKVNKYLVAFYPVFNLLMALRKLL